MLGVAVLLAISLVVISILIAYAAVLSKDLRRAEDDLSESAKGAEHLRHENAYLANDLEEYKRQLESRKRVLGELQTAYNEKTTELVEARRVAEVYFRSLESCRERLNRVRNALNEGVDDEQRSMAENC